MLGIGQYEAKIKRMQQEIVELEKQKDLVMNEIASQRRGATEVSHERVGNEMVIDLLQGHKKDTVREVNSARNENNDYYTRIDNCKMVLSSLEKQIALMQDKKADFEKQAAKKEETCNIISKNLEVLRKNFAEEKAVLERDYTEVSEKKYSAKKELELLRAEADYIEKQKTQNLKREKQLNIYFTRLKKKAQDLGVNLTFKDITD